MPEGISRLIAQLQRPVITGTAASPGCDLVPRATSRNHHAKVSLTDLTKPVTRIGRQSGSLITTRLAARRNQA